VVTRSLDPKFTVAYSESEDAYDLIYFWYDPSPEWLAKADKAVSTALRLQPDLPEVRLANARHLYRVYRDYDGALAELALARRSLPNNAGADYYEALVDNRQGRVEQTIEKLNEAITRDPRNPVYLHELATTLSVTRQFRAAEQAFDRLIELQPDHPTLKLEKPVYPSWKMEMTLQFGQQLELCRRRLPALAMLSLGNSPTPWWIVIGIKQPNSSKR
jgi:tetratricopeptide (TPR) repeat protein